MLLIGSNWVALDINQLSKAKDEIKMSEKSIKRSYHILFNEVTQVKSKHPPAVMDVLHEH